MKKLFFAFALVFVTAAFEQKAAIVYREASRPMDDVAKSLDTLTVKMDTLKKLNSNER